MRIASRKKKAVKRPPEWVRSVSCLVAPPGWVQVIALKPLDGSVRTDLDAALAVSNEILYAWSNEEGVPLVTPEIAPAFGPHWTFAGVLVPASDAYKRRLITKRQCTEALRTWT